MWIRTVPPTREDFHLGMLKRAFAEDRVTIEELESEVALVLEGRSISPEIKRRLLPTPPDGSLGTRGELR